jgi:hypothetical protein
MEMIRTNKGLLAAIAASALAIVAGLLIVGSASANPGSVALSADPAAIAAGGTSTVHLTITPASGESIGHVTASIAYDETKLTASACTPVATCNLAPPTASTVAVALSSASGLSGDSATVTFTAKAAFTTGSTTVNVTVPDCEDTLANTITCPGTGATISIATVTASPTASPTASAAATTAAALPKTGGPSSDSSFQLGWLAAAAGALIVVAAGAWTFARAREDS